MKDITKLIRRFVGILLLSTVLVIVLNIIILAAISASQTANGRPWTTAKETAEALQETETGYVLSGDMTERLSGENAWAIYIDNDTLEVKWHTQNLPDTVPLHYTISDIASLTRGYIDGYPTYTGECENGLVVVGYPKDRYWKHMSPSWDYDFIKNAPYTVLIVIGVNVFLIFLIYMIANSKLLKSVKPITNGIQALPSGEPVYVKEKGLLSDLAAKINQTSDILQKQKRNLQRKETARANWISGVSHDIRTPLSMVMGYAGQIEDNKSLPESERKKARIIRQQSTKMKNLINDLNLASKLEYNMQPIHPEPVNLVAIARQSVVDCINLGMEEKYPIEWNTDEALTACVINGDKELFCLFELLPISRSGLIFSKILLLQAHLLTHRNPCHLRNMARGLLRPDKWRIQDLVNLYALFLNLSSKLHCLLMSKLCQLDICRTTDFIFHIPYSLSMSCKIKMSHYSFSQYALFAEHFRTKCSGKCA